MEYVSVTGVLLLVLSLVWSEATPVGQPAEPGKDFYVNKTLVSKEGKAFALLSIKKSHNWFNSFMYCRRHNMTLPSLETEEEFNLLAQTLRASGFLKEHKHVWTSGTDSAEEGTYAWMSSGQLLEQTYSKWWSEEPNNAGDKQEAENCIAMDWRDDDDKGGEGGYGFNDVNCLYHRYIACEYYPLKTPNIEEAILWKSNFPDE